MESRRPGVSYSPWEEIMACGAGGQPVRRKCEKSEGQAKAAKRIFYRLEKFMWFITGHLLRFLIEWVID
jgi:hypothetical protein